MICFSIKAFSQGDYIKAIDDYNSSSNYMPKSIKYSSHFDANFTTGISDDDKHFISKFDLYGNVLWTHEIGTLLTSQDNSNAYGNAVVLCEDNSGTDNIYTAALYHNNYMQISRVDGVDGSVLGSYRLTTKDVKPLKMKQFDYNGDHYFVVVGTIEGGQKASVTVFKSDFTIQFSKTYSNGAFSGNYAAIEYLSGSSLLGLWSGNMRILIDPLTGVVSSSEYADCGVNFEILDVIEIPYSVNNYYLAVGDYWVLFDDNNSVIWYTDPFPYSSNMKSNDVERSPSAKVYISSWDYTNTTMMSDRSLSSGIITTIGYTFESFNYLNGILTVGSNLNLSPPFSFDIGSNIFPIMAAYPMHTTPNHDAVIVSFNSSYEVSNCLSEDYSPTLAYNYPTTSIVPFAANVANVGTTPILPTAVEKGFSTSDFCGTNCSTPITGIEIEATGGICSSTGSGSVLLEASVTGGGSYNYIWYPSGQTGNAISVTTAGVYEVVVSDPTTGCVGSQTYTVVEDDDFSQTSYSIIPTGTVCNNNSTFEISPDPYGLSESYSWDFDYGDVSTDQFPVNPMNGDNGYGTRNINVNYSNACGSLNLNSSIDLIGFEGDLSITQPLCFTDLGLIGYTPTSQSGSLNYTVSSSAFGPMTWGSGLAAGVYDITVSVGSGNQCPETYTVTIDQAPTAIAVTETVVDETCYGMNDGSISLAVSGGTPSYSYAWAGYSSTNATKNNLTGGNYTYTVTDDNGCTSSNAVAVQGGANGYDFSATTTSAVSCPGYCDGEIQLSYSTVGTGMSGNPTITWSTGATNVNSIAGLCDGNYSVSVTDGGCNYDLEYTIDIDGAGLWPKYSVNGNNTEVVKIETDIDDNVYVLGTFNGSVEIPVRNSDEISDVLTGSSTGTGFFLAKFDPCGMAEWLAYSMSNDAVGIDLEMYNGNARVLYHVSSNATSNSIMTVNSSGSSLLGTTSNLNSYNIIDFDLSGTSFVNDGYVNLNPTNATNPELTSVSANYVAGRDASSGELLVTELSYSANAYSANSIGALDINSTDGIINDIEYDGSYLYITGRTNVGSVYSANFNNYIANQYDLFVGVLDLSSGTVNGVDAINPEAMDYAEGMELDVNIYNGNTYLYVVGSYQSDILSWSYPTAYGIGNLSSHLPNAILAQVEFNSNTLTTNWAVDFVDNNMVSAYGFGLSSNDNTGEVIAVGTHEGDIEQSGGYHSLPGFYPYNFWNMSYDVSGIPNWLSGGSSYGLLGVVGVALDATGNNYTAANFIHQVDFYTSGAIPNVPGVGINEMLVVRGGTSNGYNGEFYKTNTNTSATVTTIESATETVLTIYPNPNNGLFNVEFNHSSTEDWSLQVYNVSGQLVYNRKIDGTVQQLTGVELDVVPGVYMTRIIQGDAIYTNRLVVY